MSGAGRGGWRWLVQAAGLMALVALLTLGWSAGCGLVAVLLPDFADSPVNADGYTIETLAVSLAASYARGNDVYLGLVDGSIYQADDGDLSRPWVDLNSPLEAGPRLVFVSSAGVVFASANNQPTWRSADAGQT